MKIWISSDTHFGHEAMLEYCDRPKDFEVKLFKGLEQIPESDLLIHLGDVCIGDDEKNHAKWIQPLKCRKALVLGNHDRKSMSWYMSHGWDMVMDSMTLNMYGKKILLTHEPLDAKVVKSVADINIHGHFHQQNFRHDIFAKMFKYDPLVHYRVAMELTDYKPVTLRHVIENPTKYRAIYKDEK